MKNKNELKWNLNDILPLEEFDKLYSDIEKDIKKITKLIETVSPDMKGERFKSIVQFDEILGEKLTRLSYLPHLIQSVNQKDQKAKQLESRADEIAIKYSETTRKLSHWIKGKEVKGLKTLDDKNAKRLFESVPELKYQLNYSRTAAQHTLNESEENIILNKSINGTSALKDLRRLFSTEFEYVFKPKGKKTKIIKTQSELTAYIHSTDKEERRAAYDSLLNKYKDNIEKFFIVYQSVVKDWDYETKIRDYKTPISMRNFANHLPDTTIDTLLETCVDNRSVFQRFFKYKSKELGVKKINRFDIYAPLKGKIEKKIELNESIDLVLNTFNQFSSNFYNLAKKIIDEKHIDSHPHPLKRSGAFCANISPKITPYVLLNYTYQTRDVFTLAHELGHGIHDLLASKHWPSAQHPTLPLAETASTLSELILFEKVFANEKDKIIKKSLLMEKLADSYASILRQNYFVIFENKAHKLISQGTTPEDLSNLWLSTLQEQFEDSVEIDSLFKYEWAYIPHIVDTPFYCYAYNFGELLSYALYARYKQEGVGFVERIEDILKAGGSEDPTVVLKNAQVDINDKKFWQGSFEVIKNWQTQLESL